MKKISLIGMPGSGKTTFSKIISKKLNIKVIDTDEYIEEKYGKIENLFKKTEKYFRDIEHKALIEIMSLEEDIIISTGGGIVEKIENMELLKSNTIVIFIDRSLENIKKDVDFLKRPLLKEDYNKKLEEIYNKRYQKYLSLADIHIINNKEKKDVIEQILSKLVI